MHHRSNEPGVDCQNIFDVLCDIQHEVSEGTSFECVKSNYAVESHPSSLKFLPAVAAVLTHPAQRGELYGEDGMFAKLDPSEATIQTLRERVRTSLSSAASTVPSNGKGIISNTKIRPSDSDHDTISTTTFVKGTDRKHSANNNSSSTSSNNASGKFNGDVNNGSGNNSITAKNEDSFTNKVKSWSVFGGKRSSS